MGSDPRGSCPSEKEHIKSNRAAGAFRQPIVRGGDFSRIERPQPVRGGPKSEDGKSDAHIIIRPAFADRSEVYAVSAWICVISVWNSCHTNAKCSYVITV